MPVQSLPTAEIASNLTQFTGSAFKVQARSDGGIVITTPFEHVNADPIALYLSEGSDGSFLLTDDGETRHRINEFKEHDVDRRLGPVTLGFWMTEAELFQTQIGEGHDIMTVTRRDDLAAGVFRLLQTIMHISGLGMVDND